MNKRTKTVWLLFLTVLAFFSMTVTCFASHIDANFDHNDPTGGTDEIYMYPHADCDRQVTVTMTDTNGYFIKRFIVHTSTGVRHTVAIGMGGYDIASFSSNQGLWEHCQIQWISGSGTGDESELYFNYEFFSGLSRNQLKIDVVMRQWEPIAFEARHYIQTEPGRTSDKFYSLYATTDQKSVEYYDHFVTTALTIPGYTLRKGFNNRIDDYVCFNRLEGKYKNTKSWPRTWDYNLHHTDWSKPMKDYNSFDESRDGRLDWCDNYQLWIEYYYDITEYTVRFDGNGGSGVPEPMVKYHGYDATIPDTRPTKSGYVFKGWSNSKYGTNVQYQPGEKYTSNASRTLYAIWGKAESGSSEFTIEYDGNGGQGIPAPQKKQRGVPLTISYTEPTHPLYFFDGWSTDPLARVGTYYPGDLYTEDKSATLYAIWYTGEAPDILEYYIRYDANGGYGAPATQVKQMDVVLTLSSLKPQRANFTFLGWSENRYATSPTYYAGGSYTKNEETTLYAVWKSNSPAVREDYTVKYNANGGYGAPATQAKQKDVALTISYTEPTKDGYLFKGWDSISTSTNPRYKPGDSYTANASVTLYAIWEEESTQTYTVSYDANTGSYPPASQTKYHNVPLTLSYEKPKKYGFSFKGWSENRNATYPAYFAGDSYTVNRSAVLFAVWEKAPTECYVITYDCKGGSGGPEQQYKEKDVTCYVPYISPTKANHDFLGWGTGPFSSVATYYAGDPITKNENMTLYAVWNYNPKTYRIWFDANGGTGGPAVISKQHGENVKIPMSTPTKTGYVFKGWSEYRNSSIVNYRPGDIYSQNRGQTLRAVWAKSEYEFSINNLSVDNIAPYKYDNIKVSARVYNMDSMQGYENIPVDLYFDDVLIQTQKVNFPRYGYADIGFTCNVGNTVGTKTIEIRVNWANHESERLPDNNVASTTIEIKDIDREVSVDRIEPNAAYKEGTTVITAFTVRNDSDNAILPGDNNTVTFTAYYMNGGNKVVIAGDNQKHVVIPSNGSNLVYFKWSIPETMAGKTIVCECTVNADNAFTEQNPSNNTATYSTVIREKANSQTPNTRYEDRKPPTYQNVNAPNEALPSASWSMWEYRDGTFNLLKYGIQLDAEAPVITPSEHSLSAEQVNGRWVMKSGYGITVRYSPHFTNVGDFLLPENDSFTEIQSVNAYFPEYAYRNTVGFFRTLKNTNGTYTFIPNTDAVNTAKEHFIPIYVENGNYIVSCEIAEIWTPVGMLRYVINSNTIYIDGTIYDDWYQK